MSVPFFLFVIAVLLFAIFWELCKIHSKLKRSLPNTPRISEEHAHDAVAAKAMD